MSELLPGTEVELRGHRLEVVLAQPAGDSRLDCLSAASPAVRVAPSSVTLTPGPVARPRRLAAGLRAGKVSRGRPDLRAAVRRRVSCGQTMFQLSWPGIAYCVEALRISRQQDEAVRARQDALVERSTVVRLFRAWDRLPPRPLQRLDPQQRPFDLFGIGWRALLRSVDALPRRPRGGDEARTLLIRTTVPS